jgi:gamma-glutamylcyclotransferase
VCASWWRRFRPDEGFARLEAQTHIATRTDARLRPFDWYKDHVLRGAVALGLPAGYVALIEATAADRDPDPERRGRELAIYG